MKTECNKIPLQVTTPHSINFAIGNCPLGLLLVASTSQGICAILLGSDEQSLTRELCSHFPQALLRKADTETNEWLRAITRYIEVPSSTLTLHLDMRGSAFQQQIWNALREIPAGQTATYKEIALKVGATAQEVGEACAANVLAVAIPCHRVVRSDGGLAGYRWGVNRKRLLLQREQEVVPDPTSLFAWPMAI